MEICIADRGLTADASTNGSDARVRLRGEVDMSTAPRLRDLFTTLFEAGVTRFDVDLAGCTFLDSTGMGVLLWMRRRCRLRGGELTLTAPASAVLRVLAAAGTLRFFRVDLGDTVPEQRVG